MSKLFKSIHLYAFILILITSCNSSNELSLDNGEGIVKLKQIMSEKLSDETEVYTLNFSATTLTGRLEDIAYSYELKGEIFEDRYNIKNKTYSDPIKYPYKIYKTFKIKDAPISIIPVKYKEALTILEANGLLKADETYYLDRWEFKTDKNGDMTANFNLNYYLNTTQSGRVQTTNYGQYSFIMDGDKSLKLKK